MSRYRHVTFKSDRGYGYTILEQARVVIEADGFLYQRDADNVGRHFASDDDLEVNLNRK